VMSRIRSKNTKLDLAMKGALDDAGIGYVMYPDVLGKPDFLAGDRIALFCDSAFWHGRNWVSLKRRLEAGSNANYWVKHISNNRRRDRNINLRLSSLGYRVLRFWDEDVFKRPEACVKVIVGVLAESHAGTE
jgi:DNA mismatch endonuclease (patch repair protein)